MLEKTASDQWRGQVTEKGDGGHPVRLPAESVADAAVWKVSSRSTETGRRKNVRRDRLYTLQPTSFAGFDAVSINQSNGRNIDQRCITQCKSVVSR